MSFKEPVAHVPRSNAVVSPPIASCGEVDSFAMSAKKTVSSYGTLSALLLPLPLSQHHLEFRYSVPADYDTD